MGPRKHYYKASGGNGIPAKLFQIPKDNAIKMLHSVCQQIWKTEQVATGLEKVSFHYNPKKEGTKERSGYYTVVLISQASKAMLKIVHTRL